MLSAGQIVIRVATIFLFRLTDEALAEHLLTLDGRPRHLRFEILDVAPPYGLLNDISPVR